MARLSAVFLAFALLPAVCLAEEIAEETWNPNNGVQALDAVENALHKLGDNLHLPLAMRKAAEKAVGDVESTVMMLKSGNGTKAAKAIAVMQAIKELQYIQSEWQERSLAITNSSAASEKLKSLEKELKEKQEALAKEEKLLKVIKLRKELVEKKLKLQGILSSKKASEESAARKAVVAGLAEALSSAKSGENPKAMPAALVPILADLKARAGNVTESILKLDAEEKEEDEKIDAVVGSHAANASNGTAALQSLKKQAHHTFKKVRAVQEAQLAELHKGIDAIGNGDLKELRSLMRKMQDEDKVLTSRTKSFLY